MTWRVLIADTVTGATYGQLPFSALSWSDDLDVSRGATLTVTARLDAPGVNLDRLRAVADSTWRLSLVAAYGRYGIVGGPLLRCTVNVERTALTLACGGPEMLLDARLLVAAGYELDPTNALATARYGPSSLPKIARDMLADAIIGTGAGLPFTLPDPDASGSASREFPGADLASVLERLGQLTQVEGGPDVHLRPLLAADERSMSWVVRIGEPHLGQPGADWRWTIGGNMIGLGVDTDASGMVTRGYVPGSSDANAAGGVQSATVGVFEDTTLLDIGWPLLERVDRDHGSTEQQISLDEQAAAFVAAYRLPVAAWSPRVRADRAPVLGLWTLGDDGRFEHPGDRWLGEGGQTRRILAASGDHTDVVALTVADLPSASWG